MNFPFRHVALALLVSQAALALLVSRPAFAQSTVPSLGQPSHWQPYVVPAAFDDGRDWSGALTFGVHRPLTNPVTGILGVSGEVYGLAADKTEYGGRLLATSRALAISAGIDWNHGTGGFRSVFSYQTAIRRGGFLGSGTMLRLDWEPSGRDVIGLGLHVPIGGRAGMTRRRDTDTGFPEFPRLRIAAPPLASSQLGALARVSESANMILAYTNLYPDEGPEVRYGQSFAAAASAYHAALTDLLGRDVVEHARANLLATVLLPFDSLFGQVKEQSTIRGLTFGAQSRFLAWLRDSSGIAPARQPAILAAHARWLAIIEWVHRQLLTQWGDSRELWMPLQLALTDDQYDEQSEVDALVERAVGRRFSDNNALTYLRTSDLPLEIARSIFATRDYHVLWTHDFTGRRDKTHTVDEIGYALVADAYLPALTRAVQRYDSAGKLPVYMILLDQFYYERRDGRLWMDILEDPLHASMDLPRGNEARAAHLRERQAELRDAVAHSRLAGNATGVKVHINILYPGDFSFRSHQIVPGLPFTPDNITRDHRKMVFYDLTESDPYRGAMMLFGVGIGEHYASATWEDRGYRVRGPAALEARAAARQVLSQNGLREIPVPLRETPADGGPPADGFDYVGRALQLHNQTGFGEKASSVARAMLYNLAPPGSVIIIPDPLWVSHTWAAMLAGAASRGCKVYIISPAAANSPNPQAVVWAIQNEVMSRLLALRSRLGDQIQRTGGELRIGLFTSRAPLTDVARRAAELRDGLERNAWIKQLFPFDSATLAVLNTATAQAESDAGGTAMATDQQPRALQLHQKTQLIARPGALAALARQPGWDQVLARTIRAQSSQTARFADQFGWTTPDMDSSATRTADAMFRGYEQSLTDAERKAVSFYFTLGTQNMDPRGLMQDGEATLVVSGLHASAGLVDLYYIMARSTWIDEKSQLDRLLPPPHGLMARVARIIRAAL